MADKSVGDSPVVIAKVQLDLSNVKVLLRKLIDCVDGMLILGVDIPYGALRHFKTR